MLKTILERKTWLLIITLIVVAGFIYSFNLNNPLFWDDDDWIINNSFVHDVSWSNVKFWLTHNTLAGVGLKSNYYRPFLFFTFAANYMAAGIKPLVYHLTSNFIHIFNGILVFWLFRTVLKSRSDLESSKRSDLVAFLTALFFLVHPLQTEAITYISGRGDALVAMFMLLGLLFFYKSELTTSDVPRTSDVKISANSYRLLAISSLVLALLSRETGIIFPVLALALYVSVLSKQKFVRSVGQGFGRTWPYFAVVLVYGILRLTALNFLDTLNFYTEPNIYSENLHVRLFTFLPILWNYIKLLFVPIGLHMERSAIVYTSLFQWPVWPVFLGLVGLLAWLRHLYKNQLATFRVWFFGLALFFIPLGPVSGITPINALMYEHWLYLPMIGFWLIFSFYLVKLLDYFKLNKNAIGYWLVAIGLIVYLFFFSYQSIRRNILWGNSVEFYKDILKYEPDSARISNNLGNFYYNQGDKEQAEFYYQKAVDISDSFAQPYFNLGAILQSRGDMYGAIKLYEKAIEINPGFYYPYQNLSFIYAQQGNMTKAAENIEVLKSLLPTNARVFYNSALVYLALNNKEQALKDLRSGLEYAEFDPDTGVLIEELIVKLGK